jgi:hypothetical protein
VAEKHNSIGMGREGWRAGKETLSQLPTKQRTFHIIIYTMFIFHE